jgi:hypothetical protein
MDQPADAAASATDDRMQTVRYVTGIPRRTLPPGQVVVHNHVRSQPYLGMNGFRAWIAAPHDDDRVAR